MTPTADQLYHVTTIDRQRKVRMEISLKDADGDDVPVREAVEKLTEFVSDKLKEEGGNTCKQQITPLMGQAMVAGMIKLMRHDSAMVMLSQEHIRYSLAHMMTVAFYLLKWLQRKNISIHTTEIPITEEDIEMYDRITVASDASVMYAAAGGNPKDIVRQMLKEGKLRHEDLAEMKIEDWVDNTSENTAQNTTGDTPVN